MDSEIKKYGSTSSEKVAKDASKCRMIIHEINSQSPLNEEQKLKFIYLMSLELENNNHMKQISSLIKRLESNDVKSNLILE